NGRASRPLPARMQGESRQASSANQKSMQRPARSQSPKRVGSGPFGPPISISRGAFSGFSPALACDGSGRAPSCCSTSSCSGPRSIARVCQKRRPFAPHPSTSAAPDFAAPPRSGSPRRSAGSARKRKGERFVHTSLLYCQVPWLCCVRVRGADAYDFLQRQLTNNPPATSDRFVLAAWNDAKGRVRSLFRVVRGGDGPLLVAERDGIDAVLAKLRIFVLRSDVAFEKSDDLEVGAVLGDSRTLLAE